MKIQSQLFRLPKLWHPWTTTTSVTEAPSLVGGSLIMTVFGMQWRKSERADYFLELEVPKRNKIRTRSSHCGYDFKTADSHSSFWFSNSQFQFDGDSFETTIRTSNNNQNVFGTFISKYSFHKRLDFSKFWNFQRRIELQPLKQRWLMECARTLENIEHTVC